MTVSNRMHMLLLNKVPLDKDLLGHKCTGAVGELQQPSPGAHVGR